MSSQSLLPFSSNVTADWPCRYTAIGSTRESSKQVRLPLIDVGTTICILPAIVRYHRAHDRIWGVATVNNVDYCTLGFDNFEEAREAAHIHGRFYRVKRWEGPLETAPDPAPRRLV